MHKEDYMETIEKCVTIALEELGRLQFSGVSVIPAGRTMDALYLAAQEIQKLREEEKNGRQDNQRTAESSKT